MQIKTTLKFRLTPVSVEIKSNHQEIKCWLAMGATMAISEKIPHEARNRIYI